MKKYALVILLLALLILGYFYHMTQINTLNKKISSIGAQVNQLQNQFLQNEASFTGGATGYKIVHTSLGDFLISLDSVTKYADGYKAVFEVGSPSLMTFRNMKGVVFWRNASTQAENSNSKFFTITTTLLPGVWNKVTVMLSPATSSDIEVISIALLTDEAKVELTDPS